MLKIRLARGGSKHRPFYRIVVADSRAPRDGRFIEKLGTYNPKLPREDANRVTLKTERIQHWLAQGAQATDRVVRFLAQAGVVQAPAQKSNPAKSKPKAKAVERAREKVAKAEAAAAAAAEAKAAAEAPAAEEEAAAAEA